MSGPSTMNTTTTPRRRRQRTAPGRPGPRPPSHGRSAADEPDSRPWQDRYAWRWWLIGLLVVVVLVLVALLRAPFFEIQAVQVSGEARTSEGAVLDALAIEEGQALGTFDLADAEAALAALPWIEEVNVTRGWPSTLRVKIRERVPAAAIGPESGREWVVVSHDGRVLERRLTPPVGVPVIVAPRSTIESAEIGSTAVGLDGILGTALGLPSQLEPWVESWTLDAEGWVRAELVGSAVAVLGTEADHRTQYVSLASILDGGTSLICISEIDLTIPDTPVIHRDDACIRAALTL